MAGTFYFLAEQDNVSNERHRYTVGLGYAAFTNLEPRVTKGVEIRDLISAVVGLELGLTGRDVEVGLVMSMEDYLSRLSVLKFGVPPVGVTVPSKYLEVDAHAELLSIGYQAKGDQGLLFRSLRDKVYYRLPGGLVTVRQKKFDPFWSLKIIRQREELAKR